MKKIFKRYLVLIGLGSAMTFSSCQKYLDVNTDPNNPSTADERLLLPSAELFIGNGLGDRYNNITNIWAQYWVGGPGVSQTSFDRYELTGLNMDRPWAALYSGAGQDLATLAKSEKPVYRGMAKILQAYMFQLLVDLHGDVPFSEAFKGALEDGGIQNPKFDTQEDIYAALPALLNSGIQDLWSAKETDEWPFTQDLIYGQLFGDIYGFDADGHDISALGGTKDYVNNQQYLWISWANTLKLKVFLRQSETANAAAMADSTAALFAEYDDFGLWEAQINGYSGTAASTINVNPLFASLESGLKNFYVGNSTSINFLLSREDPRIDALYAPATTGPDAGSHVGLDPGYANQPGTPVSKTELSTISLDLYRASAPVVLSNWSESQFLIAEAFARGWASGDDESFFNDAVTASFIENGFAAGDAAAYLGEYPYDITDEASKIRSIALEKWVALNGRQPTEGWIECRRFDKPGQTIFRGAGGLFKVPINSPLGANIHPSLLLYAQTEVSLNSNAPAQGEITNKVFWDN